MYNIFCFIWLQNAATLTYCLFQLGEYVLMLYSHHSPVLCLCTLCLYINGLLCTPCIQTLVTLQELIFFFYQQYIFRAAGTELDSPRGVQQCIKLQASHRFLDSYESLIAHVQQRRKLTIVGEDTERGRRETCWRLRDRGSIMRGETAGVLMMTAWRRHFSAPLCWYHNNTFTGNV